MPPLPPLLLFVDALVFGLVVALAPPMIALGAAAPAGALAVVACELLARRGKRDGGTLEPWRLDGWTVIVGTLAVLGLGASVGPEAVSAAWLLLALFAGLGFASLPNLAPRARP